MDWVYLSPHLDDAVLSCGGLIWEQVNSKQTVQIWSICAGDPTSGELSPFAKSLHARWQTGSEAMKLRRAEDQVACKFLGANIRHFNFPDCIYRLAVLPPSRKVSFLYASESALFGSLNTAEALLIQEVRALIETHLPPQVQVVSPMALGNHVDHQLVRLAAEALGKPLWYYADYPYAGQPGEHLAAMNADGWEVRGFQISAQGLIAWQDASAAYTSQTGTFWEDEDQMRLAIERYCSQSGGVRLWQNPRQYQLLRIS